ncbi:hypothetical protein BASA82_000054 [Batrachochytrium salamandrivorans]|nr:hypothetical protein BASA82_000054 [Batrachochytrium salamandrivorans]
MVPSSSRLAAGGGGGWASSESLVVTMRSLTARLDGNLLPISSYRHYNSNTNRVSTVCPSSTPSVNDLHAENPGMTREAIHSTNTAWFSPLDKAGN